MTNCKFLLSCVLFVSGVFIFSCKKNDTTSNEIPPVTTPYVFPKIQGFRNVPADISKEVTNEGAALGKKLFFDSILSKNNKLSCAGTFLNPCILGKI